jgi:hypothetical protein
VGTGCRNLWWDAHDAEKIQRCPADDHAVEAQVPIAEGMVESMKDFERFMCISVNDTDSRASVLNQLPLHGEPAV